MATLNFSKIEARLKKLPDGFENISAEIGWFESSQYEDGTKVAYVATIHEFGAPSQNIPPRPFIQPTIDANGAEWADQIAKGAKRVLDGGIDAEGVMDAVGAMAAGDIKKTIAQVISPALKVSTVKARERAYSQKGITRSLTKPLIDTGLMLATCTNTVVKK